MTTIYLVRHAHSIYTPEELTRPLSAKGAEDAGRVAEVLRGEKLDIVMSSPYKRAIETVAGAAKEIGVDVLLDERFRERTVAEQPVDDHTTAMDKLWTDWDFAFEGGESNLKAQERGVEAMLEVLDKYAEKRVAIGTHGNIMVLIMNYFDKQCNYECWKRLGMPDIYKLNFDGKSFVEAQGIY